jgi:hypothetical protein
MSVATLPALPGVTEPTLIVIILLMAVGGAFLGVMIHCVWTAPKDGPNAPCWALGIAFVVGFLALDIWNDHRADTIIRAQIAEQDRIHAGYLPRDRAQLQADINKHCGPRTDGMTEQLVMTITTASDLQPEVTGCTRIEHRQYARKAMLCTPKPFATAMPAVNRTASSSTTSTSASASSAARPANACKSTTAAPPTSSCARTACAA